MSSVFPLSNYFTKSVPLADNNLDTIYTCGEQGEISFDVTGLSVAATTANADTCTLVRYQQSDTTNYTLVFKGPVEADYPLQLEGLPIHLVPGDIIKAQATAGGTHTLHVHISGLRRVRDPKAQGA